jgi:hypothetical protein
MRRLAEPLDITGPTVTKLKFLTSTLVFLLIATVPLTAYFSGHLQMSGGAADIALFFGMIIIGLTIIRVASFAFGKYVFQLAPVPHGTRFDGVTSVSPDVLRKWTPALVILLLLGALGLLGPPVVAASIIVGCCCLARVWALRPSITGIDSKKLSEDEVKAGLRLSARVRRQTNEILSQWLSALSTTLAVAVVLSAILAIATPPRLHVWRWALLAAFTYVIIGSLLRASAETSNRLWIDIDVVRLWSASKRTVLAAGVVAGVAGALFALGAFCVLFVSHSSVNGRVWDTVGRWGAAGVVLGAAVGVLVAPRLAFVRRRELRRDNRAQRM